MPAIKRAGVLLTCLAVFCLTLWQIVSAVCIAGLVLLRIIDAFNGNKFSISRWPAVLWIPVIYYLAHVAGMFYTTNLDYGFRDLQTKLSFLVIPLVLPGFISGMNDRRRIQRSFISGCMLALLICLAVAFYRWFQSGDSSFFFYDKLSRFIHVTYFSVYINVALIFLLDEWINNRQKFTRKKNVLMIASALIFYSGITLLNGRMSIIVANLSLLLFLCLNFRHALNRNKLRLGILLFIAAAIAAQLILIERYNRFSQVENFFRNEKELLQGIENKDLPEKNYNSITLRITFWRNAAELISRHPFFGVGTGDIKEELVSVYRKNNFRIGVEQRYSPHNQFLHTAVILGLPGVIILVFMTVVQAICSGKNKDDVAFLFFLVVTLNCLTESMLEVQSGILFYSFFYILFGITGRQKIIH